MALKETAPIPEVELPQFQVGKCFERSEYLIFTPLGIAIHKVGNEYFTLAHANGNEVMAAKSFEHAVDELRNVAQEVGLKLEEGLEGKIQALVWADELSEYLREKHHYHKMPKLLSFLRP